MSSEHRPNVFVWVLVVAASLAVVVAMTWLAGDQLNDSRLINLSGRQRMLSQRIAKASLALASSTGAESRERLRAELKRSVAEWRQTDSVLRGELPLNSRRHRNSDEAARLLILLEEPFGSMVSGAKALLDDPTDAAALNDVLAHEATFLTHMDRLVAQYDQEAFARAARMRQIQLTLLIGLSLGLVGVFIMVGRGVWRLQRVSDEAQRSLARAEAERQAAQQAVLEYGAAERERFAQELHDSVCQMLAGVQMMLRSKGDEELAEIESLLSVASQQARSLAQRTPRHNWGHALREAAGSLARAYGAQLDVTLDDAVTSLPETVGVHLYHAAHEAVSNALRHGKAKRVAVTAARDGGTVTLRIEDDGQGFNPDRVKPGLGLSGLEARAALLQGKLLVDSEAAVGTRVTLTATVPGRREHV
ncbi:MAG: ATP-binding protein [Myxococcota bacterium]